MRIDYYLNPEKYFDQLIEINLSELEPHLNGPFTPDRATPISQMAKVAKKNNWPTKIEVSLIGSCTNSRLSDLLAVANIIKGKKVNSNVRAMIVPGSQSVKREAENLGLEKIFQESYTIE